MSDLVVDSSVVAKWVLVEPDSPQADRLLTDAAQQGFQLITLDLAVVESTNAIWVHFHRGLLSSAECQDAFAALMAMPLLIEAARPLLFSALPLSCTYHQSVYDCLFVSLVVKLGLKGGTADTKLYEAIHADFPQIILLRDY
jgi:predicted nucleic acid-binding protein